ncbi:FTR1 family protein [Bartonella sp. HY329]|uniref:iron uptake transporter permease EfeU n=1 Tax=unclassified Bartonella TaxID=2645622 RepID=UPI0021C94D7D|nr:MULTISPECIES: iron uptake transporter permease EfeU [unclassified Bartonella]UXM95562.1 FTR1 family protein [Bartonella sp. HY329]UXN09887.1 FTR1 family protein [Bartonella sp. HY328]
MSAAFLIMLREGLEAVLIVAIISGYLTRTGRRQWLPAIWVGVFLAIALVLFIAAIILAIRAEFPQKQQEMFEAIVGFLAVGVLTWVILWMKKAASNVGRELKDSLEAAFSQKESGARGTTFALIGMAFLAVAREGLESIFLLLAVFQQGNETDNLWGALSGMLLACAIGFLLYKGSISLNLRIFFRWTGVLIIFVAAGLAASSLDKLHGAGIWNHLQDIAFNIEPILSKESALGVFLTGFFGYNSAPTIGEVVIYFLYLVPVLGFYVYESKPPKKQVAV